MPVERTSLTRALALAALLLTGATGGHAAQQSYSPGIPRPPAPDASRGEACLPLAVENGSTFDGRMSRFETVYGKPALDWSAADFDGMSQLLDACKGVKVNGDEIAEDNWRGAIDRARKGVLGMGESVHRVDEYGRGLGSDGVVLPRCMALLGFKTDAYTLEDNSRQVFGVPVMGASDDDLNRIVLYANQCLTYLPALAKLSRNDPEGDTERQLGLVMDKVLLVLKRRQDWAAWRRRDTDVVMKVDGVVVPPTMTSAKAREMIERFDRAAAPGRKFTPETVSYLVRMAEEVISNDLSAYDRLYAEEIQRRVQDQIFNHVEVTPSMSNGG